MPEHKGLIRFGKRVRSLRERAGLSQEQLAEKAGIHRTYLGGVERGERNLGLKNVYRIAEALGVSVAELFTGEK
jgi:transcriptional regulator with XRE-family HTH domain